MLTSDNIIFTHRAYALGPAEGFRGSRATGHIWHLPSVVNTRTLTEITCKQSKIKCSEAHTLIKRLIEIFENANRDFLESDLGLLISKVSERTLCGALMLHINNIIKKSEFAEYKVDVEYNRNKNVKIKTIVKLFMDLRMLGLR